MKSIKHFANEVYFKYTVVKLDHEGGKVVLFCFIYM